jgi:hypothetical protein
MRLDVGVEFVTRHVRLVPAIGWMTSRWAPAAAWTSVEIASRSSPGRDQ